MSEEKIPTVKANKDGWVKCPYCEGLHQHGGNGNGIASGQRFTDCGEGEYIVIPFVEHQTDWLLIPPHEEALKIVERFKNNRYKFPYGLDVKQGAIIVCEEMIEFSSATTNHNPFKGYWENVLEEVMKLPSEIGINQPMSPVAGSTPESMPATPLEYKCRECQHNEIPEEKYVFSSHKEIHRKLKKSKHCKKCGYEIMYSTQIFRGGEGEAGEKERLNEQGIKFIEQ